MADENELLLKVGLSVDNKDLEKAKQELKNLQEEGKRTAGLITGRSTTTSTNNSTQQNSSFDSDSGEVLDVLTKSQKSLFELLEIIKKNNLKIDSNFSNSNGKRINPFGLVNNVIEANTGTAVGGAIGGIAGSFGGPAGVLGGAYIGSAIGGLVQKVFSKVDEKLSAVAEAFDTKLEQDSHLRQLAYQTGKTREELYKLQQQATLAGTTLETIVESGQNLSDELIGGIDEKKAQIFMALGINPRDLVEQAKGDPQRAQQLIYERATAAFSQNSPASYRTSALKLLGFSEEEQDARRRIYNPEFKAKGESIFQTATKGGQTPFSTNDQLNDQILKFRGGQLDLAASIRSLVSANNLAENLSTKLLEVKSEAVKVITSGVINISGIVNGSSSTRETINQTNRDKIIQLNNQTNLNTSLRDMTLNQLNHAKAVHR